MESSPSPEAMRAAMQSAPTEGGWKFPNGERSKRPDIPDHELLRCIGRGAYGEVWLARNVFGSWRAVKVVWRDSFDSDDPYEREFRGIQRYEPVSRSNDGLMDILQAGRQDEQGCFYYVMELADDARAADTVASGAAGLDDPDGYVPATLTTRRRASRRLPVSECLQLGLNLTSAVGHLHRNGLIHRDIKPSNIIFVQGVAKLADIGLVVEIGQALSFVGTEGFIPPEGPTSPQADLYSLGKVLYEVSMGKDRKEYPEPMTGLHDSLPRAEQEALMELNAVILKACAENIAERYQTAEEMQADLALLQSGKSVKWRRLVEKRLVAARKIGVVVAVVAALATGAWFYQRQLTGEEQRLRQHAETQQRIAEETVTYLQIQKAEALLQSGNSPHGLAWLAHVLRRHPDNRVAAERIMAALTQRRFARLVIAPLRHPEAVEHARFSPDRQTIVTAARDHCIRFWDAHTGAEKCPPYRHGAFVNQLTFSRDGQRVLTASEDGTACVLDVSSGTPVFAPVKHEAPVRTAVFSPDGAWIATGGRDAKLRRFSALTGEAAEEPVDLIGPANALQFSPDSRLLAVATEGGKAAVRYLEEREPRHRFELTGPGRMLAFSPDGRWLAVAVLSRNSTRGSDADWEVMVWDVASGQPVAGPLVHDHIHSLSFSSDSSRLVTADTARVAVVWKVPGGEEVFRLPHLDAVNAAAFSPSGRLLLTASGDHMARLYDMTTGAAACEPVLHAGRVDYAEFSHDGERILTVARGSEDVHVWLFPPDRKRGTELRHERWVMSAALDAGGGKALTATGTVLSNASTGQSYELNEPQGIVVWDTFTGAPVEAQALPVPEEAIAARFTGAGPLAVTAERQNFLTFRQSARIWHLTKGAPSGETVRPGGNITAADISADGRKVAVSSTQGIVVIADAVSGRALIPPLTGNGTVRAVRFSPDATLLVTAAEDGTARIWDLVAGTLRAGPLAHQNKVWFAQFNPAGDRVVTTSRDHKARIWSLNGELLCELRHTGPVEYAEFSPDGTKLVTTSGDRTARLWHVVTGKQLTREPLEHSYIIVSARFSPDGLRVITASLDGTAQLWDAATGLKLSDLFRHRGKVVSASFSGDGRHAITASLDRTAAVWEVPMARDIPDWLPELAEVMGRFRLLDEVPQPVGWEEYAALKARLATLPAANPYYDLVRECFGP
jgi:WD40 repeat protein